jgi:alpha-ketoglutarate-dependent 2,4-dichlorophenoxyacetate dioxygenase
VFRNTGLEDKRQIAFAANFGELDNMDSHIKAGRKMRLPDTEMFDVSNLDPEGNIVTEVDPQRLGAMKGNALWHADLAFNSRRAGYSMLRAHQLPPKGMGGDTLVCMAEMNLVAHWLIKLWDRSIAMLD